MAKSATFFRKKTTFLTVLGLIKTSADYVREITFLMVKRARRQGRSWRAASSTILKIMGKAVFCVLRGKFYLMGDVSKMSRMMKIVLILWILSVKSAPTDSGSSRICFCTRCSRERLIRTSRSMISSNPRKFLFTGHLPWFALKSKSQIVKPSPSMDPARNARPDTPLLARTAKLFLILQSLPAKLSETWRLAFNATKTSTSILQETASKLIPNNFA